MCSKKPGRKGNKNSNANFDFISRGPTISYKFETSLGKYLFQRLAIHSQKVAQIVSSPFKAETFGEIKKQSINIAEGLRKLGVGPGDVVSICSDLIPENMPSILGTIFIGAIVSPLDSILSQNYFKQVMNITKPKAVFSGIQCVERFEQSIRDLRLNTIIIVYGPTAKHIPFSFVAKPRINEEEFKVVNFTNPEDYIAYIICSSGTTGLPKCVALTHKNFLGLLYIGRVYTAKVFGEDIPPLKMICTSTFYWISATSTLLTLIDLGMTRVLTESNDPEIILKVINDYQISWLGTNLTTFTALTKYPTASKYDLSSMGMIYVFGSTLHAHHTEAARKIFKNAAFQYGYGATETTGFCFRIPNSKPNSIGYVVPGHAAKIIDSDTGKLLGPNEKGEICCQGILVFKEYYNNAEVTKQVLNEEGWYKTGDLGYYDVDRCFFMSGRLKEIYKYQGWQIAPLELETMLMTHPDIENVAVIGIPHDEDQFRGKGFIVKRPGSNITPEEINNYLSEQLDSRKQLYGGIVFVRSLPLTPSGKIDKHALLEIASKT